MKIETERLVIRDFQKRDVVGLLEYLSNPRVNCFAADRLCSEDCWLIFFGRRVHGVSMDLWKMTIFAPNAYANALVCAAKDASRNL